MAYILRMYLFCAKVTLTLSTAPVTHIPLIVQTLIKFDWLP